MYFSCIVNVKHVLFMAGSGCVIVILRRCISIMDVVLIIASRTCTPNALDEGGGHRDKVPSHMYHKICTYQCDATTLYSRTIDRGRRVSRI